MLAARRMMIGASGAVSHWSISGHEAVNVSPVDASTFIDAGAAFSDVGADLDPGSGEVCLVFGAKPFLVDGYGDMLLLITGGVETPGIYRFARTEFGDSDTLIQAIGDGSAGTYSVSRSGSVLTVSKNSVSLGTVTLSGWPAKMLDRTYVGVRGTHGTSSTFDNFTANSGTVSDTFSRPDAPNLGIADTGQPWIPDGVGFRPATYSYHPTDVSGLIWWLTGDTITGLSNGDPVSTWPDQSSSAKDATQSGSLRPTWVTGSGAISGHAVVNFDGTDDYLTTALSQASGDLTVYFVVSPDTTDPTNFMYLFDTQTGRLVLASTAATGSGNSPGWYDGTWRPSSVAQVDAEACVLEFNLASGAGVLYRNNVSILSASYTQKAIGGQVSLGGPYDGTAATVFDGRIAEVIIYDHALGSTDRNKINTYLHEKYGFTL